jgi:GTP-binding protein HflX
MADQIEAVRRVLAELGCAGKPTVMAFNKSDLVSDRDLLAERVSREGKGVAISAVTGEGLDDLMLLVRERLEQTLVPVDLTVPWNAQDLLTEVHSRGRVLSEQFATDGVALTARVPVDVAERLRRAAGVTVQTDE